MAFDDQRLSEPSNRPTVALRVLHDLRNMLILIESCLATVLDHTPADRDLDELHYLLGRAISISRSGSIVGASSTGRCEPRDVNGFIDKMRPALRRAVGRGIILTVALDETQPMTVRASHEDLERVLLNLVLNASDAMPAVGILTIETATAVVAPGTSGHDPMQPFMRLTVTDTGFGIPSEFQGYVLNAFFTTKPRGYGIGLDSVATTAAELGGSVHVESEEGVGTRIHVYLPLATPES